MKNYVKQQNKTFKLQVVFYSVIAFKGCTCETSFTKLYPHSNTNVCKDYFFYFRALTDKDIYKKHPGYLIKNLLV